MLSDVILKPPFPILLLVLSELLNKTVNFFRHLFLSCILGLEYVPVLKRDLKINALKFESLAQQTHVQIEREHSRRLGAAHSPNCSKHLFYLFSFTSHHLRQSCLMYPPGCSTRNINIAITNWSFSPTLTFTDSDTSLFFPRIIIIVLVLTPLLSLITVALSLFIMYSGGLKPDPVFKILFAYCLLTSVLRVFKIAKVHFY